MVFISIDELLPAAREYGEAHISIYGVMSGMAIMALSLIQYFFIAAKSNPPRMIKSMNIIVRIA